MHGGREVHLHLLHLIIIGMKMIVKMILHLVGVQKEEERRKNKRNQKLFYSTMAKRIFTEPIFE